jgi:hypothetical protein
MLLGYINQPEASPGDDVLSTEASLECFAFDRPLLLASELHVAGAIAFALTFGFGGVSLIEWALIQTFDSAENRKGDGSQHSGFTPVKD